MAEKDDNSGEARESNYSGKLGERNRNTPGRTPRELGLDQDEVRAHDIVGETSERDHGTTDRS